MQQAAIYFALERNEIGDQVFRYGDQPMLPDANSTPGIKTPGIKTEQARGGFSCRRKFGYTSTRTTTPAWNNEALRRVLPFSTNDG